MINQNLTGNLLLMNTLKKARNVRLLYSYSCKPTEQTASCFTPIITADNNLIAVHCIGWIT